MSGKFDSASQKAATPKTYEKPILIKGPLLAPVTALDGTPPSGLSDSSAPCWVARAAFGVNDIRWMIFRGWLLDDAPAWFRWLYLRYGEAVGSSLVGRDGARRVVRTLMMPAVRRKLRQ